MANTLYFAIFPSGDATPTWARANIGTNAGFSGTVTAYGTDASAGATGTNYTPTISWTGSLTAGTSYKIAAVWDDGTNTSNVFASAAFPTLTAVTLAASGSVTFSGTADYVTSSGSVEYTLASSGGVAFSGTADYLANAHPVLNASGGIVFSGAADYITTGATADYVLAASGGITFGGASPLSLGRTVLSSGGVALSGTAAYETGGAGTFTLAAGGTVALSGTSSFAYGRTLESSGGIDFSGTATPLTFSLTMTSGGNVLFSGSAPLNFQSILGANVRLRPLTGVGQ